MSDANFSRQAGNLSKSPIYFSAGFGYDAFMKILQ